MQDVDEFLAHYGVKGMRWGIRKDREKGSGRKKAKEDSQTMIYKSFNRPYSEIKTPDNPEKKGLSKGQKAALIGLGVVGVAVASYGAYRLYETGDYNRLLMKGEAFLKGEKQISWKKNAKLANPNASVDEIFRDVSLSIQPDYGRPGTVNNCLRASFAHEVARRGHDVRVTKSFKATGQNTKGIRKALAPGKFKGSGDGDGELIKALSRVSTQKVAGTQDQSYAVNVFKTIASAPERSRGTLNVFWKSGGGHAVNWEVINGKAYIFDGQTRRMYKSPAEMLVDYKDNFSGAEIMRLDNVPLNPDHLSRWVRSA